MMIHGRLRMFFRYLPCLLVGLLATEGDGPLAADESVAIFENQVAGIIQRRCAQCHTGEEAEGGLRLDQREAWTRGGESGEAAVVPGQPEQGELLRRVRSREEFEQMPPEGDRLSDAEVQAIAAWVKAGGELPAADQLPGMLKLKSSHWSLQPVIRPAIPTLDSSWGLNPIDAFIEARLHESQLDPSPAAEPRTLLRRISLDMLGLPPTREQIVDFENDPDRWTAIVDEVLASPHYGERWARHWLDVVRFGETHGFETNRERPNAWRYRDYVIEAFNADVPYDQFIREQIAGDHWDAPVATGFLVAGPYDLVKSPDINLTLMQRQDELADMINTTGTTFLGLTLGCARCHNHKFDPVTQRDYYSIQAIFAGVKHSDRPLPPNPDQQRQLQEIDRRVADLDQRLEQFIPARESGFLVLDDSRQAGPNEQGLRRLEPAAGEGTNPPGSARGERDDSGDSDRGPNLSGGQYTWWQNQPGRFLASYQPRVRGRFQTWISWGCGHATHSRNVDYVLDQDGDLTTTVDQRVLATVDQQRFADGSEPQPARALWSGLQAVGPVELAPSSVIAVRGGADGTAVTADVLVLQALSNDARDAVVDSTPVIRPPVNSIRNVDPTHGASARWVRFTVLRTNSSQPCLDELEVWSGDRNVALAANGTTARSSSNLPGYEIHQLKHINDGRHGNAYSWISNENSAGWIELELPETATIDRVVWGRDRDGRFKDRTAVEYRIEFAVEPGEWNLVASSDDRLPVDAQPTTQPAYRFELFEASLAEQGRRWLADRQQLVQRRNELAVGPVAYAGQFEQPGPTHRLYRGDPMARREEVLPDAIEVLGSLELDAGAREQQRRIAFAEWLSDAGNPLVARVLVNRVWAYHFGTGIVATPNDFGANGARPTHPELLDWLASELVRSDWSIKHIHRLILTSATYRQRGTPRQEALQVDAGTRLLWRFPPRRLEAEAIRDSVLAVTGVLDLRMDGPGFSAFRVEPENVRHYFPKDSYGPEDWRRMVYMTKVRQEQDSVFGVFDCPDASQAVPRRSRSTTPLQALNLFNSTFMLQQADLLAQQITGQHASSTRDQAVTAFVRILGRTPRAEELEPAVVLVDQHGLEALCRALLNSNEFLFLP